MELEKVTGGGWQVGRYSGKRKGDQGWVMARGKELCGNCREVRYLEGRKGGGQW